MRPFLSCFFALAALTACPGTQPGAPGVTPSVEASVPPLNLDRDQLWNYVNHGNKDQKQTAGVLAAEPVYRSWRIMPSYTPGEFKDHPLDLPTHGRYVTVYVNDIAHTYLSDYLQRVESGGGAVPVATLPPGAIVLKENYPDDPIARPLQQAEEPAVLTIAYKPSAEHCQSGDTFGSGLCLGGAWDWEFYGLNSPGKPRHDLDDSIGKNTTSFCVNCHDPGARTDYLRGLQRVAENKAASLLPTRDPAAPTTASNPAYANDPFCEEVLFGSTPPTDVPVDPTSVADPARRQRMFDCFAWRSFAALNWPAESGARGKPGPEAAMTDRPEADRVWETYKATWELFQPQNSSWDPTRTPAGRWDTPRPIPAPCPSESGMAVVSMVAKSSSAQDVANETGQAFAGSFGTLTDRNGELVRYQVLFDQTEFDALVPTAVSKSLTPAGPGFGAVDGKAVRLPDGATEVKASWKALCTKPDCAQPDTRTDFYARDVLVYTAAQDGRPATCEPQTFGLVGLHVARKTFWAPQWIWATFEHRTNAPLEGHANASLDYSFYAQDCSAPPPRGTTYPGCEVQPFLSPQGKGDPCCPNAELNRFGASYPAAEFPNRITRLTPIRPVGLNAAYQAELEGSVWANYVLVGTQWPLNGRRPADEDGRLAVNNALCPDQHDIQTDPKKKVRTDQTDCFTMIPNDLRNTSMESYMTTYINTDGGVDHVSNRSCMGCHASGTDFSFIWLDGVEQVVALGE